MAHRNKGVAKNIRKSDAEFARDKELTEKYHGKKALMQTWAENPIVSARLEREVNQLRDQLDRRGVIYE